IEVACDRLDGAEEEGAIGLDRATERPAELFAMEILERRAVRQFSRERFESLEMKHGAVLLIGTRLGDHVDDTTRSAAELGGGAAGDHLKLLYGVERDIDRRTLATDLLTEETVVEVAAIETDVVEDAALT